MARPNPRRRRRVDPSGGITMSTRRGRPLVLLLFVALVVAAPTPASGHERRPVAGVVFVVGWGDEPAYTGLRNSVQVVASEVDGGGPVTDLADSLKVEVIKGSDRITLPLAANFRSGGAGTPGDYRAWLTPTRPGSYTFRLTGTVRGQNLDQSFTSSPTTFNEVEDVTSIQFPAKDPSTGQLATRLDREFPRVQSRIGEVETGLAEAEDRMDGVWLLAMVGAAGAVLALVTAGSVAVAVRRSRLRPNGEPEVVTGDQAAPDRLAR